MAEPIAVKMVFRKKSKDAYIISQFFSCKDVSNIRLIGLSHHGTVSFSLVK